MSAPYCPPRGAWERIEPAAAGMRAEALAEAVAFAVANECDWPRSLYLDDGRFIGNAYVEDQPPHDRPLGIVRPRGPAAGLVVRHGRIVVSWGDIDRPDTTFSAAKSYLALVCGLAVDCGLIRSIDEPVAASMPPEDDGFASAHNRSITWRHLLQQSSEWQGTLWGIPDSVDRNRRFGATHEARERPDQWEPAPPGTRWEYNDVRVNRLALSLLRVFRRPLARVLRESVMDPIGASPDWEWHGYANSFVRIDGQELPSVSGGSHWGGGLFIPAADHARVGLLVQREGLWQGQRLLSREWIGAMAEPSSVHPQYGLLWWLNRGRGLYPSAPEGSLFAIGGGNNIVWVDREHDLVVVARWLAQDRCDAFMARVMASLD
jgi:CubicO group peptidase (beta-lactamase class C family)